MAASAVRRTGLTAVLAATVTLAACASTSNITDADKKYARHTAQAGAPVEHVRYLGSINGWTPLGNAALVVWTRPGEAWLLDLSSTCQDLTSTLAIGLTSRMNRVNARFDKVLVRSRESISIPCHIQQIRPVDIKAIRAAEKRNPEGAPSMDQASEAGT